jgi:hypothetical protein
MHRTNECAEQAPMAPETSHTADHDRPLTLAKHLRKLRARLGTTALAVALGMGVGCLLTG